MAERKQKEDKRPQRPAARQELAFDPIEAALRQLHDHVVSEDIPDDLLKLLDDLERGDRKGEGCG